MTNEDVKKISPDLDPYSHCHTGRFSYQPDGDYYWVALDQTPNKSVLTRIKSGTKEYKEIEEIIIRQMKIEKDFITRLQENDKANKGGDA